MVINTNYFTTFNLKTVLQAKKEGIVSSIWVLWRKVQEEFVTQRQYFAQHDIVTTKTLAYRDLYFTVYAPPKVYLLFPFYKHYHVDPWRATMRPENIKGRIEAKKRWP